MFVAIKDNKPIAWSDSEIEVDADGVTYVETDDVLTGMPDHYDYDASTKNFTKNNKGLFFDVREKRNRLLQDSDYTQLSDSVHKGTIRVPEFMVALSSTSTYSIKSGRQETSLNIRIMYILA